MANFVGKWKLESSDNFDNYMKAVGVGTLTAKMASSAKPVLTITVNGTKWSIVSETTFKTVDLSFEINKEFDETTGDGRKYKSTIKLEGDNKLVHTQVGEKASTIIRELTDGNTLVMTLKVNDVVSIRKYTRA